MRAILTLAVFLLFTSSLVSTEVQAYRLWLTTSYGGEDLSVGESVTVSVHLDTEGASDIIYLGTSVLFPTSVLEYDEPSSSTPSYILYSPATSSDSPVYMHPIGPSGDRQRPIKGSIRVR
jgi:hypothetical protein